MPAASHLAPPVYAALAATLVAACASRPPCPDAHLPAATLSGPWTSAVGRDHPLVGHVYEVRSGRYVDLGALEAALAGAHFVLLGETHDNADHHRLQAQLVRAVTASGRRPALAFEMLDTAQQPAVDAAVAKPGHSPETISEAVSWAKSGWPSFDLYRPVFAAGLEADLPIAAANLPRKVVRQVVESGESALPPELRERLSREPPLAPAERDALRREMGESHCGKLPEEMFDPLVLAQRARDVAMAERLFRADTGQGAILIAGAGHVRTDRGVPAHLARDAQARPSVSVAFVEARAERCSPAGYTEDLGVAALPFDYVVFTPGAEREDPCKAMKVRPHPAPRTAPPPPTPPPTSVNFTGWLVTHLPRPEESSNNVPGGSPVNSQTPETSTPGWEPGRDVSLSELNQ
jgi:uncharacterized iron-regulated protein